MTETIIRAHFNSSSWSQFKWV